MMFHVCTGFLRCHEIILDRASVHTQEQLSRRDFCDGAKLHYAALPCSSLSPVSLNLTFPRPRPTHPCVPYLMSSSPSSCVPSPHTCVPMSPSHFYTRPIHRSNYLTDRCKSVVDGWYQIKVYMLPCHFFSLRPCSSCFACRFPFLPCSTWEPVCRLMKQLY